MSIKIKYKTNNTSEMSDYKIPSKRASVKNKN